MNRLIRSFAFAFAGLTAAFTGQPNFRIHTLVALLVVVLGFYVHITASEWIAIVLCIGVVGMAELFNTAVEGLVDLVSPQHQPLAGKAKDVAAAAVVVVVIASVVIGILIFWKYLF
jgi:diacylglycerol kinase